MLREGSRDRPRRCSGSACLTLALVAGGAVACTGARVNHFKEFAKLGAAYAEATAELVDGAAVAAIDADSAALAGRLGALKPEARAEAFLTQNELLKRRVALLHDLQRHARVLRSYFGALGALAESDAATQIGKSAGDVAKAAEALGVRLGGASADGHDVGSFLQPAVTLVIGRFQRSALEQELAARADAIDRELNLQQAALAVLVETLREDYTVSVQTRETRLARAFLEGKLPKNWEKERRQILLVSPSLQAAELARTAAKNLRLSFQGLAEGRFDLSDLTIMLGDLEDYVALVDAIEAAGAAG